MPPGSLEMSFFSRASSAAAAILVLDAICRSEMPRRSRAWRSFPPKSSISAVTLDNLRKGCQTHEHADGRETGRARLAYGRGAPFADPANGDHRESRSRADIPERIDPCDAMTFRLSVRGKDGAEEQVVAGSVRDGRVDLRERMHGPADDHA